ncbi:MAG: TolC family protein [Epsilonproteobacteria bacterium]|nr:TolC family protein [Campylobacterota bacterium]
MKRLLLLPILAYSSILSPLQEQLLHTDLSTAITSSNKLKKSWINPVNLQYLYNKTDQNSITTREYTISINQPIFKSGAIFASIKYADFLKNQNLKKLTLSKNELIKQAYEILYNLRKTTIAIQKQNLLIANAKLDIQRKKEQFLSGVSDSSFLDNAIINKNNLTLALVDLQNQKQSLINNFQTLSNADYRTISLPKLSLVSKQSYLNNLDIQIAKDDIQVKKYLKYMNVGNSLLSVNLNANYNILYTSNAPKDHFYNLGVSVMIPLDINTFSTIRQAKLEYLKSRLVYQDKLQKAIHQYDSALSSIQTLDRKMSILKNTIHTYNSLIKTTKDNVKAGINTLLDVQNLQNSQNIAKLDLKALQIDKQIQLLELLYKVQTQLDFAKK